MVEIVLTSAKMNLFIILLYFILFPFGQLLRFEIAPFGIHFAFHILDFITVLAIPTILFNHSKPHPIRRYFYYFWYICLFSLLIAMIRYPIGGIVRGSLYLARFISYYFFFEVVWNYTKENKERKQKVLSIVIYSLLVTATFGWLQYFYSPDLRYLKIFNWDDHFYRLTGTVLDPGFMGILMGFGSLITGIHYYKTKKLSQLLLSIFFLLTLGFTYSRASYISLIAGVSIIFWNLKKFRYIIISLVIISLMLFLLPKGEGEGVNLFRTNSIFEKVTNYRETIEIISDFPVFGTGFNTLCSERINQFNDQSFESHSCSGSDSSFLFILATTGVLGLFAFIKIIFQMVHSVKDKEYSVLSIPMGVSLLIHSLFLNSLFYPWVMGVLFALFALTI